MTFIWNNPPIPLWACHLFFPQWLSMAIGFLLHYLRVPVSHLFSLGHPWLVCFSWDSLALFLTLYSHGLLLTSLGFPSPITLSSFLRFMGLPSTPYFLYFHYFGLAVAHSHFSTSYTAHEFAISLFPGSFKPICLLKAHLFISWTCDPLFLLLGLNGFSIYLPTLFCPCCWASSFLLTSKMTINNSKLDKVGLDWKKFLIQPMHTPSSGKLRQLFTWKWSHYYFYYHSQSTNNNNNNKIIEYC